MCVTRETIPDASLLHHIILVIKSEGLKSGAYEGGEGRLGGAKMAGAGVKLNSNESAG